MTIYNLNTKYFFQIQRAARKAKLKDKEICGELRIHRKNLIPVFLRNNAQEPGKWRLKKKDLHAAKRFGAARLGRVGTFHSHPYGWPEPGQRDKAVLLQTGLMLIYDVIGDQAKLLKKTHSGEKSEITACQLVLS